MALALDAASLNAIAVISAVASRAWVHEKLGRSDVEVSCVCPLLCSCVSRDCASLFVYFNLELCAILRIPASGSRQPSDAEDDADIHLVTGCRQSETVL